MAVSEGLATRREAARLWREFIEWTRVHQGPRWVFRGQAERWPLKPTVGRSERYTAESELRLFLEFKRLALPHISRDLVQTEWDWLFVAQHHGLPTRLLDWTTNPLIAAFFATEPSPTNKKDGEIIAIEARTKGYYRPEDPDEIEPFKVGDRRFVLPSALATRITSQRGLFSVHPEPGKAWRLPNQTDRFIIPASIKREFRALLFGLGIDAAFVMADLDGLAKTLKWRYEAGMSFE